MAYRKFGSLIERVATTVTSGGTLVLANNTPTYQQFTGTNTHNVTLPQANGVSPNECPNGLTFVILNRSTGAITVKFNSGSTAITLAAASQTTITLIDNTTSDGTWDATIETSSGTTNAVLTSSEILAQGAALGQGYYEDSNWEAAQISINPDEIGGDFSISRATTSQARSNGSYFALNGMLYATAGVVSGGAVQTTHERFNPDTNYWLTRTGVTVALQSASGYSDGTYGYIVGGSTSGLTSPVATNYQYNDGTNAWATKNAMGSAKWGHGCYYTGSYAYATPGTTALTPGAVNATEAFSATLNAWYVRQTSYLDSAVEGGCPAFYNGYGYIINPSTGWSSGPTGITAGRKYNEVTNTHSLIASTVTSRSWAGSYVASSMFVHGGYVSGGSATPITTKEQYLDASNVWTTKSAPTTARAEVAGGQSSLNYVGYAVNGWVTGGSYSNLVEEFRDVMYVALPITKRNTSSPVSLYVASNIGDKTYNVPARVRTDGDTWKYLVANSDSALRLNEATPSKFTAYGNATMIAGDNSGDLNTSETYNENANSWLTRATMTTARSRNVGFTVAGLGFSAGGSILATSTLNTSFDDILNAYVTKAALTQGVQWASSFSISEFGYVVSGQDSSSVYKTNNQQYNPTLDSWAAKSAVGTARTGAFGFNLGDQGYFVGGYAGSVVNTNNYYNPITDSWATSTAPLTANRESGANGVVINGYAYVIGGDDGSSPATSTIYRFDPSATSWATRTLSSPANMDYNGAFRSFAGNAITAGGSNGASNVANVYSYNPNSDSWSTLTAMNTVRRLAAAANPGPYRNYEVQVGIPTYLAALGGFTWSTSPSSLPYTLSATTGVSAGGFGYALGGITPYAGGNADNKTIRYSEGIDSWVQFANLNAARYNPGSFSLQGVPYVYQGIGNPSSQLQTAEMLNLATNTFTSIATTSISAGDTVQGASLNGYGYALGGDSTGSSTKWNNSTSAWSSITACPTLTLYNRFSFNGFIYATGAVGSAGAGTGTHLYNDASNAWTNTVANLNNSVSSNSALYMNGNMISVYSTACEQFNDAARIWKTINTIPVSGNSGAHLNLGTFGYVAGGGSSNSAVQKLTQAANRVVLGAALKVS